MDLQFLLEDFIKSFCGFSFQNLSSKDFVVLSILRNNLALSKIKAQEKIELAIRRRITDLTTKSALKIIAKE